MSPIIPSRSVSGKRILNPGVHFVKVGAFQAERYGICFPRYHLQIRKDGDIWDGCPARERWRRHRRLACAHQPNGVCYFLTRRNML